MTKPVLIVICSTVLLLVLAFGAGGQSTDPMQYCSSAESIRDLAAYQTANTVEVYLKFANPNRQGPTFSGMVSVSGKLTVWLDSHRLLND